jgi:glycosyltransferase involved in cell wall biosynthesis
VLITVLTCLLLLSITIQLGYVLYFFGHIFSKQKEFVSNGPLQPVSLIICARNEAHNLSENLPQILAQRYSNEAGKSMYEVIVVNDASTDDTEQVLYELSRQYDNLWSVTIAQDAIRTLPGKKFALSKGIEHAGHELILLTDADCKPTSEYWLAGMVAPLLSGKEVAAGIGIIEEEPGLLNKFIRWETMHTFLQYSTYAAVGKPYMAVGRNLACTKQALLEAQESGTWAALPSGDDDLLINAVAGKDNTALVTSTETMTISPAKATWADWISQKQRHLSTGKYYKPGIKAWLATYASSHALMWLTFLMLLFSPAWQLALAGMLCRGMIYWIIWQQAVKQQGQKDLFIWFPLFDLGWMIYNFAFSPYIIFKNKTKWK